MRSILYVCKRMSVFVRLCAWDRESNIMLCALFCALYTKEFLFFICFCCFPFSLFFNHVSVNALRLLVVGRFASKITLFSNQIFFSQCFVFDFLYVREKKIFHFAAVKGYATGITNKRRLKQTIEMESDMKEMPFRWFNEYRRHTEQKKN